MLKPELLGHFAHSFLFSLLTFSYLSDLYTAQYSRGLRGRLVHAFMIFIHILPIMMYSDRVGTESHFPLCTYGSILAHRQPDPLRLAAALASCCAELSIQIPLKNKQTQYLPRPFLTCGNSGPVVAATDKTPTQFNIY
jgi:hypothetical protein